MNFDGIVGQKEIIKSLENAVLNDKVAHAYIFTGPEGIGKRTVAEDFAGVLVCSGTNGGRACGSCICCQMFQNGSNPDFHMIEADGGSIGVEDIRGIQSEIIVKPLYAGKKVYLIVDADKMTVQAQNCLLKTLEEPPHYAVIILTTSNDAALLETIKSRTLKYAFKKNTREEILKILEFHTGIDIADADFITAYADGVPGVAIDLAGSGDFASLREKAIDLVFKLSRTKLVDIFEIYDFFEANKSNVNMILDIMLMIYRDLLVARKSRSVNVLINSDKKDIILNSADRFPLDKLMSNIQEIESTRRAIKQNANYQLAIEVMLMKLQED